MAPRSYIPPMKASFMVISNHLVNMEEKDCLAWSDFIGITGSDCDQIETTLQSFSTSKNSSKTVMVEMLWRSKVFF